MNPKNGKKKGRKGKQFRVVRNFNGKLTAAEYVARLALVLRDNDSKKI